MLSLGKQVAHVLTLCTFIIDRNILRTSLLQHCCLESQSVLIHIHVINHILIIDVKGDSFKEKSFGAVVTRGILYGGVRAS